LVRDREVGGSNPLAPTKKILKFRNSDVPTVLWMILSLTSLSHPNVRDPVSTRSPLLRFRLYVFVALMFATALKLYLALTTLGSPDVLGYQDYLIKIKSLGGVGAYYAGGAYDNPFNVPPLNIPVIIAMGWLADLTGLPFRFWLRLPCILADIGSFLLVWALLKNHPGKAKSVVLLMLAVCPASIMISGFHGNSDPVMIFFVLLSIYLLEKRKTALLSGLAFGLAVSVKVVPLIFVPAFIFYLSTLRARAIFLLAAAGVFFVGAMPYVLLDPQIIAMKVFGYSSYYGVWGWTRLLSSVLGQTSTSHPTGLHATINIGGKVLLLLSIFALSFLMNRKKERPSLFIQCGVVSFLFMALTPGFGIQYLSWCIPFVIALGLTPTIIYYFASSLFLFIDYQCWAWWPNQPAYCGTKIPTQVSFLCWLSIIVVLMIYRRLLAKKDAIGS
jgi:hypothetical protein